MYINSDELAANDGLKLVGQCPDLNTLRTMQLDYIGQQIFLKEHTNGQKAGGGIWYLHSLQNDKKYNDDDGCQIINNFGQVLRRKDLKNISSEMFGLQESGDFLQCLKNMYKASRTFSIEEVWITKLPYGKFYIADTGADGSNGFVGDISDGLNFFIRGVGLSQTGPVIMHRGNGKLMRISRNHSKASFFWASGGFEGLRIVGRNDAMTGNNTYPKAIALEVSDIWGAVFKNIFIQGYESNKDGAAISLYNDTAWTEGAQFESVMVRNSVVVLKMSRNTSPNSTATDSFFGARGVIDANADVPSATTYLQLGDGTEGGECLLYGHDLTIRGWMSKSSWHTGIDVTDYSKCVNGRFTFIWDGYGINTDSTTEVLHMIRARGKSAQFDCDVSNYSGQGMTTDLSLLQLVWNSCMYTQEPTAVDASLNKAYPVIRPKGLKMQFTGTFTPEAQVSGKEFNLNSLLPGQRLRVRLHSWINDKYQPQISEWEVAVRGTDHPCILTPLTGNPASLSTKSTEGLVDSSGTTVKFLTEATISDVPYMQNTGVGATTLQLSNGQKNNGISYATNSGRKIKIILPINELASRSMSYQVEIEVL